MASPYRLGVVIPVFNDWDSLELLVDEVNRVSFQQSLDIDILVIDDGSTMRPPRELRQTLPGAIQNIEYLRLMRNVGHQRAIATGLV
ncbi:MAG: glycosyltransferase, partial [Anaerolineae bacterium]|nr:glycosyltransferase [Anaerolineae bacterium]